MQEMARSKSTAVVRRSPRAPARVKVKFNETSTPVVEKRKRSFMNGRENDVAAVAGTSEPTSQSPIRKKSKTDKAKDNYCWLCHKEGEDQACVVCPRVYHFQCLGPANRFTSEGVCPECRLTSTDGTDADPTLTLAKLSELLPFALNRMSLTMPLLKTWPCSDEENDKLIRIMDISILEDRLNTDTQYESTADFLADVKWIFHNCNIIFGPNHNMTTAAKKLVKSMKQELCDIEACSECYLNATIFDEDFFSKVCSEPHTLVWAKLKGFPFWPAKVLKVIDSVADVRFFGSHEKGKVPVSQCFLLSEESPTGKNTKHATFTLATEELNQYVRNVVDQLGKFQYASPRTVYYPGEANHITKLNMKKNVQAHKDGKEKRPGARGRPPKKHDMSASNDITVVPVQIPGREVTDLIDIEEEPFSREMSPETELEIIGMQRLASPAKTMIHKQNFLNNLELSKIPSQWALTDESSSSVTIVDSHTGNVSTCTTITMTNTPPLNSILNNSVSGLINEPSICMDFCVEDKDSEENIPEPLMDFQVANVMVEKAPDPIDKDSVEFVVESILNTVAPELSKEANSNNLRNEQMTSVADLPTITSVVSTEVTNRGPTEVVPTNTASRMITSTPISADSQVFVKSTMLNAVSQTLVASHAINNHMQPLATEVVTNCTSVSVQVELPSLSRALSSSEEENDVVNPDSSSTNPIASEAIETNIVPSSRSVPVASEGTIEMEVTQEPIITSIVTDNGNGSTPNSEDLSLSSTYDMLVQIARGGSGSQTIAEDVMQPQIPYTMPNTIVEALQVTLRHIPSTLSVEKYIDKNRIVLQATLAEMWSDVISSSPAAKCITFLLKELEDLKQERLEQTKHTDDIKINTDLIIRKMKDNLELEKQQAVADATKNWEEEKKQLTEEIQKLAEEIQKLTEEKRNLTEDKKKWAEERKTVAEERRKKDAEMEAKCKAFEEERRRLEAEKEEAIIEAKKCQWCAYCHNKSHFYCCWNTSYCDSACQEADWVKHIENCEHSPTANGDMNNGNEAPRPLVPKKARKTFPRTNINGFQARPNLTPNGQAAVFRYMQGHVHPTVVRPAINTIQSMQTTNNFVNVTVNQQGIRLAPVRPQVYSNPNNTAPIRGVAPFPRIEEFP